MYGTDDPRSSLASAPPSAALAGQGIAAPEFVEFDQVPPDGTSPGGSPTWYWRGQNFVLAYTALRAGDSLVRQGQEHEYVVLLTGSQPDLRIDSEHGQRRVTEPALVVVPPGDSALRGGADTVVIRLFDCRSKDVLDLAANAESYAEPHPRVAALEPWPDPVGGPALRVYTLDGIPAEPGRFGRIFRTSSFMVNVLDPQDGPRDPEKLSPHHHDDFEQCSLAVAGEYVHHIRTPWTSRRSQWHEDEHRRVGSPSVAIIPPPTVHTSEAVSAGTNQLIDIFCPPREDFSAKPGWVLNADDYPQR
jgi:hypothetical protein